jgi:pilus assembly protein Flp/PilA
LGQSPIAGDEFWVTSWPATGDLQGTVANRRLKGSGRFRSQTVATWRPHIEREKATMKDFAKSIHNFLVSEDGPTAVEYAVMLALIVVVCLTAIQAVGNNANTKFGEVRDALT